MWRPMVWDATCNLGSYSPCAVSGAVAATEGIRGAVALIHGSAGCKFHIAHMIEANDPEGFSLHPSCDTFGQNRVAVTNVDERDIVLGTEAKLRNSIEKLVTRHDPQLIAVICACSVAVTGEYIEGLCQELENEYSTPILCIDAAGFRGNMAAGFRLAAAKICERLVNTEIQPLGTTVNLIGPAIPHYNWKNDCSELTRLLGLFGITVNAVLACGTPLADIEGLRRAALNIVTDVDYGLALAAALHESSGIPFVCPERAPIGVANTEAWLCEVLKALGLPPDVSVLSAERARVRSAVVPVLQRLAFKHRLTGLPVAVFARTTLAVSLAHWLHEYVGLNPVLVGLESGSDCSEWVRQSLADGFGYEPVVLPEADLATVDAALQQHRPAVTWGSAYHEYLIKKSQLPTVFLPLDFPVVDSVILSNRPFVGLRGVLTLVEDLYNCLG